MRMSNQEAIEIIELARAQIEWDYPMDYAVAFDMAISAIKAQDLQQKLQPTCNQLATDTISRKTAIDALCRRCDLVAEDDEHCTEKCNDIKILEKLPSAKHEYEPVKAEDFAKTMSENTLYGFMAWYGEVLELMEKQGVVICKKTL